LAQKGTKMDKIVQKMVKKVLFMNINNWIPHQVGNDRCGIDSIRGQISRLRFAPLEMTPGGGMAVKDNLG
jgi:hypothetical protein